MKTTNTCGRYDDLMAEALSGTLTPTQQTQWEAHLATCEGCAAEYQGLQATLNWATQRERPVQDEAFWAGYTERLEARLVAEAYGWNPLKSWLQAWHNFVATLAAPRWTYQLAVALLLVAVGIGIGRVLFAPATPQGPGDIAEQMGKEANPLVQQAAVQAKAFDYVDRSKVLLLGLVNFDTHTDDPTLLNLPRRQQVAQTLVDQASTLKTELTEADQQQLHDLIADLEVILLQIANLEATYDAPAIELVQQGVDRKAILLKINLEKMRRDRDAEPSHSTERDTVTRAI